MAAKTKELDKLHGQITDADLARIGTFRDLTDLFKERGIEVENVRDFGTGFVVLKSGDKERLVNVPFVIVEWRYSKSSKFEDEAEFAILELVTMRNEKFIITDASTGIYSQLKIVEEQRAAKGSANPTKGLLVENGLSKSDYETVSPKTGEVINGTTYYLAM